MEKIKNQTSDIEREYYGSKNIEFSNIKIEGPKDGESAFKECKNIKVSRSSFKLRYPFWHNKKTVIYKCKFATTSRAPFWYDKDIVFDSVNCKGVKAIRECKNVEILNSNFDSIEIGWSTTNAKIKDSILKGSYAFSRSKNLLLTNVNFTGKYSFQYCDNIKISGSVLNTKDAFWHSKNVIVENSIVNGEYLAWYSEDITFINCEITGTQPICYAKNIKFINCTMHGCDLAFEYSSVEGNIDGEITSIKNPLKGDIVVENFPELIVDKNNRNNKSNQFFIKKKS